jgi:hypothetical protein
MEGFERIGNIPATRRDLANQGYDTMVRGGSVSVVDGIRITMVMVVRGMDLAPQVVAEWAPASDPTATQLGLRMFDNDEQLATWLRHWNIQLGRRERRV